MGAHFFFFFLFNYYSWNFVFYFWLINYFISSLISWQCSLLGLQAHTTDILCLQYKNNFIYSQRVFSKNLTNGSREKKYFFLRFFVIQSVYVIDFVCCIWSSFRSNISLCVNKTKYSFASMFPNEEANFRSLI